jgi:ABC-2 type transport system permease protein
MTNVLPYLVFAVVVIFVGLRLRQRRRGAAVNRRAPRSWAPGSSGANGDVSLVAMREVRERTRSRMFRIGTAIILLVVAAAIVIPVLRRGHHNSHTVGVVGTLSQPVRAAVTALGPPLNTTIAMKDEPAVDAAKQDLDSGAVDIVIVDGKSLLVKTAPSATATSTTATVALAIASTISVQLGLEARGIPPAQAAQLAHPPPLPINSLQPARNQTGRAVTTYALILIFLMLSQYGTWILMGVVEEKSSRVIEVLLAALRPVQLLTGKVIGIGLVALLQAALVLAVALGLGGAVGSDVLHGGSPLIVFDAVLWLVLGYVFYCWVYAAAGSLASRQEHLQTVAFPLQIPLIVGYIAALTAIGSGSASLFLRILAYLPPTAPFAMPVLVALADAAWWQVVLSAVITVAATVIIARLAATVYLRAILRTGERVRLRDVITASADDAAPPRTA